MRSVLFAACANSEYLQSSTASNLANHLYRLLSTKDSVALYVAHDNGPAAQVYHRVGFVGLDTSKPPVEGVDSWLEVGFDRAKVTLGHW